MQQNKDTKNSEEYKRLLSNDNGKIKKNAATADFIPDPYNGLFWTPPTTPHK